MNWKGLLNIGSQHVHTRADVFRLNAMNAICYSYFLLNILDNFILWSLGLLTSYYLLVCSLAIVTIILILRLRHLGKHRIANTLLSCLIFVFVNVGYLMVPSSINYEIIFLGFLPTIFITLQGERKLTFLFLTLYISAFLVHTFFPINLISLSPYQNVDVELVRRILNCYALAWLLVSFFVIYRFNSLNLLEVNNREQTLLETQVKLEQANRLKSNFLANMSHEIRTPMNGILGFSKLLAESDLPKEQAQFAEIVHEGSKQLLAVVNDVLDFSKIETGQVTVVEEILDVHKLAQNLKLLFGKAIADKGLVGTCTLPKARYNLYLQTDAQKVRQILTNLISNAIKFTTEGSIKMQTTISEDEQFIRFAVKDTGIGIAACDQATVFERFQRVKLAKGQIIEGTGLGLTISKNYAELLGGSLILESELGVGSVFTLSIPYLPISSTALNEQYTIQDNKQARAGCTILLAEDVLFNTLLVQKLLADSNINLHCVQDGKAAVEFVKKYPDIDIVLMDIMMPILDGRAAMLQIKKIRPALPIIALTAFGMNEEKLKLLQEGFDSFVSKPIQAEDLIQSINTCLQKVGAEAASQRLSAWT